MKGNIMAEEIKTEEKKCECGGSCKCGCKAVAMFIAMILASFLGCLVALCLFKAAMKPPVPMYPRFQAQPPVVRGEFRPDFNRGPHPKHFGRVHVMPNHVKNEQR